MALDVWLLDKLLVLEKRVDFLTTRSNENMATLQDVHDKIEAEKAQVAAGLGALQAEIQALKDQIGNGVVVTAEQLDALMVAVDGIFTPEVQDEPAVEEPTPEEPADPEVPAEPVV